MICPVLNDIAFQMMLVDDEARRPISGWFVLVLASHLLKRSNLEVIVHIGISQIDGCVGKTRDMGIFIQ